MTKQQVVRIYPANTESVSALEQLCLTDEANLIGRIVGLKLGTSEGEKVTVGTFELASEFATEKLKLEEYETDIDEQRLKAIHGNTFRFSGQAYIKGVSVNVLAFGGSHGADEP